MNRLWYVYFLYLKQKCVESFYYKEGDVFFINQFLIFEGLYNQELIEVIKVRYNFYMKIFNMNRNNIKFEKQVLFIGY